MTTILKRQLWEELDLDGAAARLGNVVTRTPLTFNEHLSRKHGCNIYLKREDQQLVRSYKLRGAYNMISGLDVSVLESGIVCASAGNHAQGVAWSCRKLGVNGTVFMPVTTPRQKLERTKLFGEDWIDIRLVGDTFDDCNSAAVAFAEQEGRIFIPPFDHIKVIEGQSTVGAEIFQQLPETDYLFLPVGGGGLAAGVGAYFKRHSPHTKIIGMEPFGAASMWQAFEQRRPITLPHIDRFVDGAAVKRVGDITFEICSRVLDDIRPVAEGKICTTIMQLYNEEAIVAEPAGALSVAGLEGYAEQIAGKNVVCIISGGNNDMERMQEIRERSMLHEGLKHYLIVSLPQRAGGMWEFISEVIGPHDNLVRIEYLQKNTRSFGPILIGVEVLCVADYHALLERMNKRHIRFVELNEHEQLFGYLV